jgi:hypothetical protein
MLERVVHDLDEDRIDGEGFTYFAFTWDVALRAIQDAERRLGAGAPGDLPPSTRDALETLLSHTARTS